MNVKVKFDDISYSGFGVGQTENGAEVYAWNAFPGEVAEVELFSKKKAPFKGTAVNIIKPSPHRIDPREDHFLVSAPWQVIGYDYEVELKRKMFAKIWQEIVGFVPEIELFEANPEQAWHYRNVMEFNVVDRGQGLELALMSRGREKLIPIKESKLVFPAINQAVNKTLENISSKIAANQINQIIVKSNRRNETMVGIYDFENKLLYARGLEFLEEEVNGFKFHFGLADFWQPNITVFEKALETIGNYVRDEIIVDMYSGVGVIGLGLSNDIRNGVLVELSKAAIACAEKNIKLNNIKNMQIVCSPSEKALEHITNEKVVIFDPPRTGLDKAIVERLKQEKPKRIIYLSCKPYTQCRDIKYLLGDYQMIHTSLYNFFPRTPHLESLVVLEQK